MDLMESLYSLEAPHMPSHELYHTIVLRKCELEKIIQSKKAALDKSPEGSLRISGTPEKPMYYYRSDTCSFGGSYLNKDHMGIARQLAQRDYDRRILKSAQAELEHLNRSLNLLANKIPVELVYERLRLQRQSLVDPIHLPDAEYLKLWLNQPRSSKIHQRNKHEKPGGS